MQQKSNTKTLITATLASLFLLNLPAMAQDENISESIVLGTGDSAKYYKWTDNSVTHGKILTETIAQEAQVTVNYNEADKSTRLTNPTGAINNAFIDLTTASEYNDGPAIYTVRGGDITSITGTFANNQPKPNITYAYSGAIYNSETKIDKIDATFVNNHAIGYDAIGGAIYSLRSEIGTISGSFIGNYAHSIDDESGDYYVLGGALRNYRGTVNKIDAYFEGNHATSILNPTYGGAVNNEFGTINELGGTYVNNYTFCENTYWDGSFGGAVSNSAMNSLIKNISANFKGNHAGSIDAIASGGAIYNDCTIEKIENSTFINNYAFSKNNTAQGGALSNSYGTIGEIINTSFIGNYAISENGLTKGGAIYTNKKLTITADNFNAEIKDNYTKTSGTIKNEAIYLDSNAKLTINLKNNGSLLLKDTINGTASAQTNFTGDNTGTLYLHSDINTNTTTSNITINTLDNVISSYNFKSLTLTGDTNMVVDVDLANAQMDKITADTYGDHGDYKFNVIGMNMMSDAVTDITEIKFAQAGLKDNVEYGNGDLPHSNYQSTAYTPIYKYNVAYDKTRDDAGYFMFTKGDKIFVPTPGGDTPTVTPSGNPSDAFNPAVLGSSTGATVGAMGTVNQTMNYAFQHSNDFMNIPSGERMAIRDRNKYALHEHVGPYSPLFTRNDYGSVWVKPYAAFESVNLKNGPKVSSVSYGTLIGFDTGLDSIKGGWNRTFTGYIGYNGASQSYGGADTYQNGGLLGGTLTLYKGNFFNATTLSTGASVANNSNMYGNDNYSLLLSGVGNKTGYNFEFKEGKFIIQPSMLMSYTFVNTFDYTNAAGVRIDNNPFHSIQLSPGVKFIGNTKNGWQPYLAVSMVWNLLGKSDVRANGVKLPEMTIKPYIQYGVGVQKRIKGHFMGYGQAMIHNGGRNGVSLTVGFRWALPHANCIYKEHHVKNDKHNISLNSDKKILKQMNTQQRYAHSSLNKKYANSYHTKRVDIM